MRGGDTAYGQRNTGLEVHDAEPTLDIHPLRGEPSRTKGRRLAIVDALATKLGVEPRWDGKAVWFELRF